MINTPWMLWVLLAYLIATVVIYAFELRRLEAGPGGFGAYARAIAVFVLAIAGGVVLTLVFASMSAAAT